MSRHDATPARDDDRERALIHIRVRDLCMGPVTCKPSEVDATGKSRCCSCGKLVRVVRGRYAHHKARPKARLALIKTSTREYQTEDGRYRVHWDRRQGARSVWVVSDKEGYRSLRADTLAEARITLRDMRASEPPGDSP